MKAVIYARVSSTDESQSYERQISDLKKWAEYKQLEIVETFAEKISGFRKGLDERVAFNEMIKYIEDNNIKHIFISELSRLSRRYIDTVNFISDCTKKGISIHIHKEGLATLDEDGKENSIVQMLTGMLSSMAQQESQSLSHRIKSGKQYSASKGGGFNQKIYGYDKGEDGKPIINEEHAELVRKMFEMLLQGIGTRSIANYLNENYDTKDWKSASVHSIVRNTFYCGKRKYNDLTIDVPAIVDEETYNQAQEFINKRKRFVGGGNGTHVNPFASFIKCQCGATMNQIIIKSNNLNLYRCADNCGVKSVNRSFLIREVKESLERNAKLTKDQDARSRLKQKIKTE
jgi:DNA invertase Pin-like site-specific DNA recombinase